jgi:hypothetical protein
LFLLDVVPFHFVFLLEVDDVLLDCFVLDPGSDKVLLPGERLFLFEDAPDVLLVCVVLFPVSDEVLLLGEVVLLCKDDAPEAVLLLGEVEFLFDKEVDVRFLVTALEALKAVLLPSGSVLDSGTSATSCSVNIAAFLPAAAIRLSLFSALVNVFLDLLAIFGVLFSNCHKSAAQIFAITPFLLYYFLL